LDSLKSQVVPETEVDDAILRNPIALVATDFRNDRLIFELSMTPNTNWIMAFHHPKSAWHSYPGSGPESFQFTGNKTSIGLSPGMSAKQLVEWTKSYIDLANRQYSAAVVADHKKRLAAEREALRRKIAEEERRQKILEELKS
jgi:hypothetical protein